MSETDKANITLDEIVKLAKIRVLKKIAAKTHGGEHKSQDYIDGYNEMRGKILFEVNRLSKGLNDE